MNVLLDTHAFLWAVTDDPRLTAAARAVFADSTNSLFLSVVSMWEIVLKAHAGKLQVKGSLARFFADQLARNRLSALGVSPQHVLRVAELPRLHRDPFDRLLVAQAQVENMLLLTADTQIRRYSVKVVW
jgi:PIN domain nuclease of toxin-antitoxin system